MKEKHVSTSLRLPISTLNILRNNAKFIGISNSALMKKLILSHNRILSHEKESLFNMVEHLNYKDVSKEDLINILKDILKTVTK